MRKGLSKSRGRGKNIIVLLLDTVRASDVYGNASLPVLGGLSRHATVYKTAVSPGTWTAPSHAALFTDRSVSSIRGVSQNFFRNGTRIEPWFVRTRFLNGSESTLAGKLSNLGYYSVLLSNNPFLTSFTNLASGFNKVYDIWLDSNIKYNRSLADKMSFVLKGGIGVRERLFSASNMVSRIIPGPFFDGVYLKLRKKLDESVARADGTHKLDRGVKDTQKVLERHLGQSYGYTPSFMFVNYIEAHENYPVGDGIIQDKWLYMSGVEELNDHVKRRLHDGYLKRIRYLDKGIGKTLSILKDRGVLENATVVLTSDHGQLFGEHGLLYHSLFPYREEVEVPLIGANFENGKLVKSNDIVERPTSLLSLHRAVLDLASGAEAALNGNLRRQKYVVSEHSGISEGWDYTLLSMLKKRSRSAEMIYKSKEKHNMRATTVYHGAFKLMHFFGRRADEFYNIEKDPTESENILQANRDLASSILRNSHIA